MHITSNFNAIHLKFRSFQLFPLLTFLLIFFFFFFRRGRDESRNRHSLASDKNYEHRSRSPIHKNPSSYRHHSKDRIRSGGDDSSKQFDWGKRTDDSKPKGENNDKNDDETKQIEKEKPNFGLSGKLTEDANKVNGVVIKYSEPSEARKPKRRWRLYPFKGDQSLQTLYIHRQSCFLIGRDRKVCDIPVDHPSCSKQHAALQYRLVPYKKDDGTMSKRVRPYVLDMESANGTFVNNQKIEAKKYLELFEKDVIKFGFSSREYVLLHENSKEDQLDDDVFADETQPSPKSERSQQFKSEKDDSII